MPEINENLQQGRYRVVSHLGQNGIGSLYEAHDNSSASNVLLREIPVKLNKVTTPAQLETLKLAFAAEARALAAIGHASFIRVREYFSEIDRHYLVMDLVPGDYLSDVLENTKTAFSLQQMTAWADHLLDALNYLHTQVPPVIHRDLRPQNVKLTPDGNVRLLALGAAKVGETKSNTVIAGQSFDAGMLNYLPLEQIWGKLDLASQKVITNSYSESSVDVLMQPADARSDIYALGATLYHLVTARRPVDALERSIDLLEGKADPLPIPSKLNPNIPPEVSYVLMKAMDIKRENRFESAIIMRQVLKTAVVRVKEREAKEGKRIEVPAPTVPVAELKRPEAASQAIHTTADTEADLAKQMEMIKNRLREAEAQRSKAEQRADDAEKRLREKEQFEVVAYAQSDDVAVLDIPAFAVALDADAPGARATHVLEVPSAPAQADKKHAPKAPAKENDFAFSYAGDPEPGSGTWKVLAAAAVVVILLGGGIGAWMMNAKPAGGAPQSVSPAAALSEPAQPAAVTQPQSQPAAQLPAQPAEPAPDQSSHETLTSAPQQAENSADTGVPAARRSAGSALVQIAAAKPEKKAAAAAQPAKPAPQKKAVTVDDLINDH
jgi:serine/threonine protein kinase